MTLTNPPIPGYVVEHPQQRRPWWETRWFVLCVIVLTAVPLLQPTVPPLVDLPGHMARYQVMLGADPGLARWYSFHWHAVGNLGVDLLVLMLGPAVGLEPAVKIVVIAIALLAALGIVWISREAHGRIQPLALAALPLVYNFAFHWGFLNYTLAMALALNAFALWLRLGRLERQTLRAILFVPIGCAIWTAHLFGWIALGVLVFAAEWARARDRNAGAIHAAWLAGLRCLPLAPPVLMFLAWRPSDGNATSDYLASLRFKPGWLVGTLRDRWMWLDLGSTMVIALLLYGTVREPTRRFARPVAAATIGLMILFVALPFGSAYLDARFAPYLLIMALLAPSAENLKPRVRQNLAILCLAFFLVRTASTTISLALTSRDWDRHLIALDHIPRGARVVAFVNNSCPRHWAVSRLNHLPSFMVIRRGGFANDQFDMTNSALLRVITPGLGHYGLDPSQIVTDDAACAAIADIGTLDNALYGVPRQGFDYVWLIDPPVHRKPQLTTEMIPVWSDGRDTLLRVIR